MSDLNLPLQVNEEAISRFASRIPQQRASTSIAPSGEMLPGVNPAPTGQDFDDALGRMADKIRSAQDQSLARNISVALESDPDLIAEAQRIGLRIAVDPQQVETDLEGYRKAFQKVQLERWQLAAQSPILKRQMLDPEFARSAYDDLPPLGEIERIGFFLARGYDTMELGFLEAKIREGEATAEDFDRARVMREQLGRPTYVDAGFLGGTAEIVGQMAAMGPDAILGAGLGAAVGGLITLGTGGLGAPLVPLGAQIGAGASFFNQSRIVEGGYNYREMIEEGVDPETAYWVSHAHGLAAGTLELVGILPLAGGVSLAVRATRQSLLRRGAQEAAQALTRPSTLRGARDFAVGWISGVGGEVITEGLQEISGEYAKEFARWHEGRPSELATPEGRARFQAQVAEVMAKTAKGMALLALPGPALTFVANQQRIAEIQHDAAMFEKLAAAQQDSKVHARSPEQAAAFGNEVVGGTNPRKADVYISGEKFAQSMEETNTSREVMEATLPGFTQKLESALETGGDVVMTNGEYQGFIIGQRLDNSLRQYVRFTQDGIAFAELPEVKAVQAVIRDAAIRQVQDSLTFTQEGARLEELFRQQVQESGRRISRRVARDTAAVYRAFVETQARRLSITPFQLVERIGGATVERGERAAQESLKQPGMFGDLTSDFDPDAGGGSPLVSGLTDEELRAERERIETILERGTPVGAKISGIGETARTEAGLEFEGKTYRKAILTGKLNDVRKEIDFREGSLQDPEARAEFIPETGTIRLFDEADLTSILHELAHGFLHWYGRLAAHAEGPTQVRADMEAFLDWAGFEGTVEEWNALSLEQQRPYHEKFAETFETYAFQGTAPSLPLQRIFSRFRAWIVELWRGLRGDVEVSDDIRGVFDRMLASQEAIEHAEAARGMTDTFRTQPEGMTDEQWTAIQQRQADAREAAIATVQKRSLKNIQWLDNATAKELRKAQRAHDQVRSQVRAAVAADIVLEPAYRAMNFLRNGVLTNERGTELPYEGPHKLRTSAVKEIAGPGVDWKRLRITTPEGLDPDAVAQEFGYSSGEELINTLDALRPIDEVIDQRTDSEMLRKHGDLQDAAMVRQAVHEALHNKLRARSLAAELKAMTGATQPVRLMIAGARERARQVLADTPVGEIKASRYQSAEARANREAFAAASRGDTGAVIDAKWAELLQHELAREAAIIERQVERAVNGQRGFRRFGTRKDDERIGKTRDVDLVKVGRAILTTHGVGRFTGDPEAHLAEVRENAPRKLADLDNLVRAVMADNTPYQQMTWSEFELMTEAVNALWEQAKRENQIKVDGELQSKRGIVDQLLPSFPPPSGTGGMRTTLPPDERARNGRGSMLAYFRHVESWAMKRDGGTTGLVWRYLFDLLRSPYSDYRAEKTDLVEPLHEAQKKIQWKVNPQTGATPTQAIEAPELNNFQFSDKWQLLGAMQHMGNASNLEKLLSSYEMTQELPDGTMDTRPWWNFIDRMIEEGVLQQADFDYLQAVWNTYESLYPRSIAVHKEIYGFRPEKIEAQPFVVRDFGEFAGGYYPATIDREEAQRRGANITDPAKQQEYQSFLKRFTDEDISIDTSPEFQYAMSAGRGFLMERTDVRLPLLLDVQQTAQTLDNQIRFIHMQVPARDMMRLLNDRFLGAAIDREDPNARELMFKPWVRDTVRNRIMQSTGSRAADNLLAILRKNVGLSSMFTNLRVGLQQFTGLASTLNLLGPGGLIHARDGAWSYYQDRKGTVDRITAESKDMRERLGNAIGQIVDGIEVVRGPRWLPAQARENFRRIQEWFNKYGFWIQRLMQTEVDVITYNAARNKADAEGMSEKDSIKFAEAIVRRSQGSGLAPDVSAIERGKATTRLLLQFQGFWIAMANQFGSKPTLGSAAYITFGVGLSGAVVAKVLEGGWEDEDDNGELWDDITKWTFIESVKSAVAPIPFVRAIPDVVTGEFGGRISFGAFLSQLERSIRGIAAPITALRRDDPRVTGGDVRNVIALWDTITGIPLAPLGRAIGYELDAQEGRQREGNLDFPGRGYLIGR